MKSIVLLLSTFLILGNAHALNFEPVTISQANQTPKLTQLESDFSTFRDIYENFANLCSKYDRYFYREGLLRKEHDQVAHEAFKETYKDVDRLPDYELNFRGYLPQKGELLIEAASRATGNVHVDWFSEVLGQKFPSGEEFRRAQRGVLLALQTLAVDQRVLLYTGLAQSAKTQKHVVVLIDPDYQQVLLIQAGYCN